MVICKHRHKYVSQNSAGKNMASCKLSRIFQKPAVFCNKNSAEGSSRDEKGQLDVWR